jgi:hypothetical protein
MPSLPSTITSPHPRRVPAGLVLAPASGRRDRNGERHFRMGSCFGCDGRGRRSIQALPFVVAGLVAVTYLGAQDR